MEIKLLQKRIRKGYTQREIAIEFGVSQSTVRYYLKKYDLRTENRQEPRNTVIVGGSCLRHGSEYLIKRENDTVRCKKCTSERVSERRKRIREQLVEEFGGACSLCGYDRHIGSLNFHHKSRETKSFKLSNIQKSMEKCREEAKKCILLCANCHQEVHAGVAYIPS